MCVSSSLFVYSLLSYHYYSSVLFMVEIGQETAIIQKMYKHPLSKKKSFGIKFRFPTFYRISSSEATE